MRHAIAVPILGLLAAGLLVAGCGGGGSDSIDKAGFVEQANAICKQATVEMRKEITAIASRESGSSLSQTNTILMKEAVIPAFKTELEEIRALGTPSEGRKQAQAFLVDQQKIVKAAEANPENFFEANKDLLEATELAGTRYGVSECPLAAVSTG